MCYSLESCPLANESRMFELRPWTDQCAPLANTQRLMCGYLCFLMSIARHLIKWSAAWLYIILQSSVIFLMDGWLLYVQYLISYYVFSGLLTHCTIITRHEIIHVKSTCKASEFCSCLYFCNISKITIKMRSCLVSRTLMVLHDR